MTPEHTFDAELELDAESGGVFARMPFSVPDTYGVRGLLPIHATIDGFPYRGSLTPPRRRQSCPADSKADPQRHQ
ncbi:DUF1905 domain-containing protein [Hymenobacter sp. J193]|uniref:DUF1905 domain-containing protein n=1 Tax=Hymenobacter sp. J193 TaxID=2898429 RepID=UPI0021519837|nr:DUF1905 domain-containing protein [Hymenobacter sp. J193]MCR5889067.1 DUF1905 domain-containing protein [Hymenobacter sp. J193]